MKWLGRSIGSAYRGLSLLNTLNILLSGNPKRIQRHLIRKTVYKDLSKIGRYHKRWR